MCANNLNVLHFTTKISIQTVVTFMTAYKYSLYIYHNFFLDNVFSTDRLHFPDITQLFLTPHPNIFFIHIRYFVQRTSGNINFFIRIYDITIYFG